MKISVTYFIILFYSCFLLISININAQTDAAPVLFATGNQAFCPGSSIKIVTDFTITDADDTTISAFFIQISNGYQINFDLLNLTGNHPNIISSWNNTEGKLTLTSSINGGEILLTELESAVKDIEFSTTATNINRSKSFSLTIDDANYLPATDHFYEFVDVPNITWSNARTAAENRTYYGRQGYLATLTSQIESDFAGKQASGAGWIGGSDEASEGVWKWVTGPEAGLTFWNGQINGSTPNFAFWNNNEPNDFRGNNSTGEDYAHITDPSIGMRGAWNDLPNEGGTGLYIPKGYIVEYGKPGDPPLNIVASTEIYIPEIQSIIDATICESGSAIISANTNDGQIYWYDSLTSNTEIFIGNNFTTPILNTSTTYYAAININGCSSSNRSAITVTVNQRPIITNVTNDLICSGSATLSATSSSGQINWYESLTSVTPIYTGQTFETPFLNSTTSYFVTAINNNCDAINRTEIIATVDNRIPQFNLISNNYILCEDIGFILLETTNAQDTYTYVWKKDGVQLTENTPSINSNEIGTYTVSAISNAGCESQEETISVINSEKATLTKNDIIINDDSIQVTNLNLGIGDYEFSLDDPFGIYKNEGFFDNISTGIHSLYIKDKGGCGITEYQFSILSYPKFFSPNGDGENDLWQINGYNKSFYTVSNIYIYNRFGKQLFVINSNNEGWNGNYSNKKLPSSTYWFKAVLTDINGYSIEKTGNFSLIR